MPSILEGVDAELKVLGVTGWRADTARGLASSLDETPNASMARELRSLMTDLGSTVKASAAKGDVGDDLASKRARRIAAATG